MGIYFGAVQSTETDILGMSKISARWVPRMLTDDQKRTHPHISRYLLSRYEDDPSDFIELVVSQDETWVHHFDPESKMQSKQRKHPGSYPPKKFKRVHSAGKVMASIFWDSQGVIMIKRCITMQANRGRYARNSQERGGKTESLCYPLAGQRPCPSRHKLP